MSKTWYPVIDYDKCTGCLVCYEECTHDVYKLNSEGLPKVVTPEGCIENCKTCGDLCPTDAITYNGDTSEKAKDCCCCGDDTKKQDSDSCCDDSKKDTDCCNDKTKDCCSDKDDSCCDSKDEKSCCSDKDEKNNCCSDGCC